MSSLIIVINTLFVCFLYCVSIIFFSPKSYFVFFIVQCVPINVTIYSDQLSHCFHILGKPGNKEDCTPVFILIKSFSRPGLIMLYPIKNQLTQHLGDIEFIKCCFLNLLIMGFCGRRCLAALN